MESVNDFARYSQKTAKSDSDPIVAYRYREGVGAGVAHRRFAGKGRRFAPRRRAGPNQQPLQSTPLRRSIELCTRVD